MMVSLLMSAALTAFASFTSTYVGEAGVLLEILHLGISLLVISTLFGLIFKLIPDVRLPWGIALRGGMLTAVLFGIGKTLLGIYLGRAAVASAYGAAGALVVFLIWTYYSAQILLFGAEFTKVLAEDREVPVPPAKDFKADNCA